MYINVEPPPRLGSFIVGHMYIQYVYWYTMCIFKCTRPCLHICTCVCVHIHVHVHLHIHAHAHAHIHAYKYTCTCTRKCTYTHTRTCMHMNTHFIPFSKSVSWISNPPPLTLLTSVTWLYAHVQLCCTLRLYHSFLGWLRNPRPDNPRVKSGVRKGGG